MPDAFAAKARGAGSRPAEQKLGGGAKAPALQGRFKKYAVLGETAFR
jgi:hypothetical protein